MRRLAGDGLRGGVTAVLLGLSVLSTALLAVQAHYAATHQRATAEQLLADLAGLAGHELVRRSTARLGYDGYGVLLAGVRRRLGDGDDPAILVGIGDDGDERLRRAARLARRYVVANPAGEVRAAPPGLAPPVRSWLQQQLARRVPADRPYLVLHGVVAGAPASFVLAPAGDAAGGPLVGFELEPARIGEWFAAALAGDPLLPPSVGHGQATNGALQVSVRDQSGVERYRSGRGAAGIAVELPFGDAYSGVLAGWGLRVAVAPVAARALVTGGLPRSRLPILLALLGLSTGLVVVALLQLRRERALQRLRDEFVASVSHELRTPLAQIRMFAETLLLDRARTPEERTRALEIVDREARRLAHIVENVLLFSRDERGASRLLRERRPVAPLVREVLEQFAPLAAAREVRLVAQLDESAEGAVDGDAFRQVLLNLLDNAVKYGPRGQELRVELERDGARLRLSVDDEGPGVPVRARRRVFDRFQRLERDRRSAVAGTGIGLAVVRDLALRHGGRASVEDGSRGGARFVVELPA
jgi:signal transduction histidine kinase